MIPLLVRSHPEATASPGSSRFPRHANQQVREADGFPDMRISKSGKQVFPENLDANPEKSGFCGKSRTPAHVRFFPKPFISFASAQLRLRWHSPCARRRQQEVADRKPGGCERPRGHNPRAVVTGFKIHRCRRMDKRLATTTRPLARRTLRVGTHKHLPSPQSTLVGKRSHD